jgi:Fe(3+) dicitrate transport protein
MINMNKTLIAFLFLTFINNSNAQNIETKETTLVDDETLYVLGSEEDALMAPGAATFIDQKELEKFQHTDINRVLKKVPGVYIQEEDGYGLRPNIGLRGAHPHRSKKVTIMQDGVLIGPAPYSAPAAYYFPLPTKMTAIEVFKGPSAIKYGPNSIGGAVNLVTRPIPQKTTTVINVATGPLERFAIHSGGYYKNIGNLIEINNLKTDGFKFLPNGENTGFDKNDIMFKNSLNLGEMFKTRPQKLSFKFNYSDEDSKETYLGLSDADFEEYPYQRYAASDKDHMKWYHKEFQTRYAVEPSTKIKLTIGSYLHQFSRNWSKLNGFKDGTELRDVLADPTGVNESYYRVVKGLDDSTSPSNADDLLIGNNARTYESKGAFIDGNIFFDQFESMIHSLSFGLRYHIDEITRDHTVDTFSMNSGTLVRTADARYDSTQNTDKSWAISAYLEDEATINNTIITLGSRVESVKTKRVDHTGTNADQENKDFIFNPGFGVNQQITDSLSVIAGANKGVTLVAPGQDDSIKPEEAINYEFGLKYNGHFYLESIAFYSDYENIKGTCSFSTGCTTSQLDSEFNGGKASIYGVEVVASKDFKHKKFNFPTNFSYTYTKAEFASSTTSTNSEWGIGEIIKGDPMPYVPEHKASASVGLETGKILSQFNISWTGQMADQAVSTGRKLVTGHGVIDWIYKYKYSKASNVYVKIDNILNNEYAVSLRPYGVRPGKPRMITYGFKQTF